MPKQRVTFEVQGSTHSAVLKRTSEIVEALEETGNVVMIEVSSMSGESKTPERGKLMLVDVDDERKIMAIKNVRAVTGMGLKESKDAVEMLMSRRAPVELMVGDRLSLEKALLSLPPGGAARFEVYDA